MDRGRGRSGVSEGKCLGGKERMKRKRKSFVVTSGGTNKEFNLRHDWHSLFSSDEQLQMRHYSTKYFPHADEYVRVSGGCRMLMV